MGDEGATAHAGCIRVAGPDAEVLTYREGRHVVVGRGGEETVDVFLPQPCVLQGAQGCLPDQVERRETRPDLSEVRFGHSDYGRPTPQAHLVDSVAGTKTATGPSSSSRTSNCTPWPISTSSACTPS